MHRGFFLPVKALPPAPNGPGTGGGRCHATYLCGERFNSRPPRGERRKRTLQEVAQYIFQSTPSARRATRGNVQTVQPHIISIHAPREEGDHRSRTRLRRFRNFNPRPPRGGRRISGRWQVSCQHISIHAPREEGDCFCCWVYPATDLFQSTPPARRATFAAVITGLQGMEISIHALREEGDPGSEALGNRTEDFNPRPPRGGRPPAGRGSTALLHFNPRPPRGGRPTSSRKSKVTQTFQSTPSARRATAPSFFG